MQRKTQSVRPTQSAQAILHQISQVVPTPGVIGSAVWSPGTQMGVLGYSQKLSTANQPSR